MHGGTHGPGGHVHEKPIPPQENYAVAEAMAIKAMERLDARRQAERLGATVVEAPVGGLALEMDWFGRPIRVTIPGGGVANVRGGDEIPIAERIVILHYAGSTAPVQTGTEPIGFAEVPSGAFYLDAFVRRAHRPLAAAFGRNPKLLLEAGEIIGAASSTFGDASVIVHALPKVPITAVVFGADEEFGAEAKILYAPSIVSYFVTEDIAVLGGFVAQRLTRALRQLEGMWGGK
jgi:hypothetical protein